jgi:hypothetical protein
MKLVEARLCPADADLRLGFGRIDPTSDTIFRRVARGMLGMKDAVRQVEEFRQSEQATGS